MRRESGRRPRAEYKLTDYNLYDVRPPGYFKRSTHKEIRRMHRVACREEEALMLSVDDGEDEEQEDEIEEYYNETYISGTVLSDQSNDRTLCGSNSGSTFDNASGN